MIAYVPSGYLWGAISQSLDPAPDAFPSWSYGGVGLPYVDRIRNDAVAPDQDGALTLTPAYLAALNDTARAEAAAIPVERVNGPIILVSGEADALWPSAHFSKLIVERLKAHQFSHPVESYSYAGAGHTIGPPTLRRRSRRATTACGRSRSRWAARRRRSLPLARIPGRGSSSFSRFT